MVYVVGQAAVVDHRIDAAAFIERGLKVTIGVPELDPGALGFFQLCQPFGLELCSEFSVELIEFLIRRAGFLSGAIVHFDLRLSLSTGVLLGALLRPDQCDHRSHG